MFVHALVCVHVHVHVWLCKCVHSMVYMCQSEDNFLESVPTNHLVESVSLMISIALPHSSQLFSFFQVILPSLPSIHYSNVGTTHALCHNRLLMWILGIKLESSILHGYCVIPLFYLPGSFSPFIPRPQTIKRLLFTFWVDLPTSVSLIGSVSQIFSEVCFHDYSRSCQILSIVHHYNLCVDSTWHPPFCICLFSIRLIEVESVLVLTRGHLVLLSHPSRPHNEDRFQMSCHN